MTLDTHYLTFVLCCAPFVNSKSPRRIRVKSVPRLQGRGLYPGSLINQPPQGRARCQHLRKTDPIFPHRDQGDREKRQGKQTP